jgi:hypothetical protein
MLICKLIILIKYFKEWRGFQQICLLPSNQRINLQLNLLKNDLQIMKIKFKIFYQKIKIKGLFLLKSRCLEARKKNLTWEKRKMSFKKKEKRIRIEKKRKRINLNLMKYWEIVKRKGQRKMISILIFLTLIKTKIYHEIRLKTKTNKRKPMIMISILILT